MSEVAHLRSVGAEKLMQLVPYIPHDTAIVAGPSLHINVGDIEKCHPVSPTLDFVIDKLRLAIPERERVTLKCKQ